MQYRYRNYIQKLRIITLKTKMMTQTMQPVIQPKLQKQCASCNKNNIELLRCSKCKKVYYCGTQCQKLDWGKHRKICGVQNYNNSEKQEEKVSESEENKENKNVKKEKQEGLNQFGKLTHVGTGNFSIIYKTVSKKDDKTYAIKQVQKAKVQRMRKQADIIMQKHCLTKLKQCPHVVKLYKTFQDELSLYFQLQFPSKGELWQLSKVFGVIPNSLYKYYMSHIVKAIAVLHNQYQIVHRDLKPQNILLDSQNRIKLIDFGTAKDLDRPDIKGAGNGLKGKKQFQHYVGTAHYMAPECIHNKASEKKSDIYSLSGIFYFMKVGSPPFQGGSQYLTFTKSLQNKLLVCPELFDEKLQDLVGKMNAKQLQNRIDINQVMAHPYFQGLDFNNLPSYSQCIEKITQDQKYLISLAEKLGKIMESQKQPSAARRKQIYDKQIKPIIEQEQKKLQSNNSSELKNRLWVIDVQCQTFLNIRDNNNVSFTQIYEELKGITHKKAQQIPPSQKSQNTEKQQKKDDDSENQQN